MCSAVYSTAKLYIANVQSSLLFKIKMPSALSFGKCIKNYFWTILFVPLLVTPCCIYFLLRLWIWHHPSWFVTGSVWLIHLNVDWLIASMGPKQNTNLNNCQRDRDRNVACSDPRSDSRAVRGDKGEGLIEGCVANAAEISEDLLKICGLLSEFKKLRYFLV